MQYSVVDYQSIVDASHSLRLDAEFFHPDYLQVLNRLEEIGSRRLSDFQVNIRHPQEIKRNYVDDGILFLRAQNVRPLSIDLTSNLFIYRKKMQSVYKTTPSTTKIF